MAMPKTTMMPGHHQPVSARTPIPTSMSPPVMPSRSDLFPLYKLLVHNEARLKRMIRSRDYTLFGGMGCAGSRRHIKSQPRDS